MIIYWTVSLTQHPAIKESCLQPLNITGVAVTSLSEVRHVGNKAPGQLAEYTEISKGILRKKKKILF